MFTHHLKNSLNLFTIIMISSLLGNMKAEEVTIKLFNLTDVIIKN